MSHCPTITTNVQQITLYPPFHRCAISIPRCIFDTINCAARSTQLVYILGTGRECVLVTQRIFRVEWSSRIGQTKVEQDPENQLYISFPSSCPYPSHPPPHVTQTAHLPTQLASQIQITAPPLRRKAFPAFSVNSTTSLIGNRRGNILKTSTRSISKLPIPLLDHFISSSSHFYTPFLDRPSSSIFGTLP